MKTLEGQEFTRNYWPNGCFVTGHFKYHCWMNMNNTVWQELLVFTILETGFQLCFMCVVKPKKLHTLFAATIYFGTVTHNTIFKPGL